MTDDNRSLEESAAAAAEIADTLTVSASTFANVLRTGLREAVVEGRGLSDVLRKAALSISSAALSRGLAPLSNLVGQGMSGALGGLGGAIAGGSVRAATSIVPFAKGGVIGAPTGFAMGGGKMGLMGEAGREAVLPLARGSDGRLGVALEGGGGQGVTINVTTPDAESFRRSEAQVTSMLARAVTRGRRGL